MRLPRSDLRSEGRCVIDPAVKTLAFEDAQLNFSHVQPTSFLGNVVELEAIKVRLGFIRWEESIESGGIVRVEVIDHNPDAVCIRVVDISEFDHSIDPLGGTSPLGNLDVDPASQRFRGEVNSLFAVAFVAVID